MLSCYEWDHRMTDDLWRQGHLPGEGIGCPGESQPGGQWAVVICTVCAQRAWCVPRNGKRCSVALCAQDLPGGVVATGQPVGQRLEFSSGTHCFVAPCPAQHLALCVCHILAHCLCPREERGVL